MGGILLFLHQVGETYTATFTPRKWSNFDVINGFAKRKQVENLTLFFWKATSSELLRMRFENQAYLLKQMEEKDSRKNEAPGSGFSACSAISGTRWFGLPLFLERQLHVTSKIMDQKMVVKMPLVVLSAPTLLSPDVFWKKKISTPERCSFFRQEKYLQQIQAAILERDAEAQRVVCMRVTGKDGKGMRFGCWSLIFCLSI